LAGPDSEQVGEVAGVPVFAPAYLRALYPAEDGVTVDVEEGSTAESMSIETEYGCRFILRDPHGVLIDHQDQVVCDVPESVSALRSRGRQELPEALRVPDALGRCVNAGRFAVAFPIRADVPMEET